MNEDTIDLNICKGNLLGELDVIEDDEGTLYIEDGTVIDTGSDVVVTSGGFDVSN